MSVKWDVLDSIRAMKSGLRRVGDKVYGGEVSIYDKVNSFVHTSRRGTWRGRLRILLL